MGSAGAAETKLMSATPREFYRSLRAFAPDLDIGDEQSLFLMPVEAGEARIEFTVLPPRQVTGLLSLPQMQVTIDFEAVSEAAQQRFISDFDLAFRRGGG